MKNSIIKCPRDGEILTISSKKVDQGDCSKCSGVLIDIQGLPSVKSIAKEKLTKLKHSELHCPICLNKMHELLHETLQIDICAGCRCVWLDPGEEILTRADSRKNTNKDEPKWYDNIDPISFFDVGGSPKSNSVCSGSGSGSGAEGEVLELLGDVISSVVDGL